MRHHCSCRIALLLMMAFGLGCSGKAPTATPPLADTPSPTTSPASTDPAPQTATPRWSEPLSLAQAALAAGKVDEARQLLDEIRDSQDLTDEARQQIAQCDSDLAARSDQESAAERDTQLARVADLISTGQFDEATLALDTAAARKPTEQQTQQIQSHRKEIDRIRGAQRKLGTFMKLLGSTNRSDVRAAQNALVEEAAAALPLLLAALREPGDHQRTVNVLETLRQLRKPSATLPAIVGLLERPEQRDLWPDAIETLSRISENGAGPLLLNLLTNSVDAEQRTAALLALSRVPDPPSETVITLLPQLHADGAELPAILMCASQAIQRHHQTDLVGLHHFGGNVTAEQAQQLAALSSRLEVLRGSADAKIAGAARMLSVVLGQTTPEPLTGVQVLNVSGEYPEGLGKAVLDGVWNSTDLKTMWYHLVPGESQIVFDLGEERTVTGVVIWNFNQPGGQTRGWKRAEVYVSPTPTTLTPITEGIIPMAPGTVDPADYSTVIPVPCVTGRYVKLKAKELWSVNAYTGLSEVQLLGY